MSRLLSSESSLESLLQPESELEKALLEQPELRQGLYWGEPRFGHPEGAVALHVREVLDNIDHIRGRFEAYRPALRLVAIAHDAFKYAEDRSRPRDWSKHHGLLARRFMEKFTGDSLVLDVIEMHDDAYYFWLSQLRDPFTQPLSQLMGKLDHCLQLYYLFFKCDTQTGDKTQAPLRWFEASIAGIEPVLIRPFWPWEKM